MYSEQMWQNAKKKCRLNDADIALAKRLGLNPRSLIKNIPSKSEPWKAPISVWLHEMDAKQQKKDAPASETPKQTGYKRELTHLFRESNRAGICTDTRLVCFSE